MGTGSWFWGIDDFGLYGTGVAQEPFQIVRTTLSATGLQLNWTGPAGPYQVQSRATLDAGTWQDYGTAINAAQRSVILPTTNNAAFYRIRLAR